MSHVCHAHNCKTPVPPEFLFCGLHWSMTPAEIRARVWQHYRPGQCDDKNPSGEWMRAADAAITAVAAREQAAAGPKLSLAEYMLARGADCQHCPMADDGRPSRPVPSEWQGGERHPTLAIVGEGPGKTEVIRQRPFVGASGKMLEMAIHDSGAQRSDVAILNAFSCGPVPSTADTTKRLAALACRPRLLSELKTLAPKTILAVGATAMHSLTETKLSITAVRGALLPPADDLGLEPAPAVFATTHPAAILRGGDGERRADGKESKSVDVQYYFLAFDFAKALAHSRGQAKPWEDQFTIDDTDEPMSALTRVIKSVGKWGYFGIDTETDGKDSMTCGLTSLAICTPDDGYVMGVQTLARLDIRSVIRMLFASPFEKELQNKIFDLIVCDRHGMPIAPPTHDTMLRHHCAYPGLPHKLDAIATQFFITPPWKVEFKRGTKEPGELKIYNGRDAQACPRLRPVLDAAIDQVGTRIAYEADRALARIAVRMRIIGIPIDRAEQTRQAGIQAERRKFMAEQIKQGFAAIEPAWIERMIQLQAAKRRKKDPEDYIARTEIRRNELLGLGLTKSGKQRGKRKLGKADIGLFKPKGKLDVVALLEVIGVPFDGYTKTGLPVTDKNVMERAAILHPLLHSLVALREAIHADANFISGLKIGADNRVHVDWSVNKIEGRFASSPNFQNFPTQIDSWPPEIGSDGLWRRTKSGNWICPRDNPRAQVCTTDGRILVGADFSALHFRIAALLSGDEFLYDCFATGKDMHPIVARGAYPEFGPIEDFLKSLGLKPKTPLPDALPEATVRTWWEKWLSIRQQFADVAPADPLALSRLVVTRKKLWERLRFYAKSSGYARLNESGEDTILGIVQKGAPEATLDDVRRAVKVIDEKMPGIRRWHAAEKAKAAATRQSRSILFDRVRLYPLGAMDPNVIVAHPLHAAESAIQARSILRFMSVVHPEMTDVPLLYKTGVLGLSDLAMITQWSFDVQRKPLGYVELIANGHDSLLVECEDSSGERVRDLLGAAMTQRLEYEGRSMTFPAEPSIDKRWSRT